MKARISPESVQESRKQHYQAKKKRRLEEIKKMGLSTLLPHEPCYLWDIDLEQIPCAIDVSDGKQGGEYVNDDYDVYFHDPISFKQEVLSLFRKSQQQIKEFYDSKQSKDELLKNISKLAMMDNVLVNLYCIGQMKFSLVRAVILLKLKSLHAKWKNIAGIIVILLSL